MCRFDSDHRHHLNVRCHLFTAKKLLAVSRYPDVSLKRAREKRDDARRLLADDIDPSAQRKAEKLAHAETFETIAAEWLNLQRKRFSPASIEKAEWMFSDLLNPFIGSKPITTITAPEILTVLRKLEARGKHETAHRLRQRSGQVFRYAVATGRALRDPTVDLRGALAPIIVHIEPPLPSRNGSASCCVLAKRRHVRALHDARALVAEQFNGGNSSYDDDDSHHCRVPRQLLNRTQTRNQNKAELSLAVL